MNISADNCSVVILAGGQGTRLSSRSGDLPKAMVNILGKPCLHHQIDLCLKYGFTKIALLVHHRYEKIYEYFGDGSKFGVCISYVIEEMPRGTAGALRDALPFLSKRFLVMYGDTYIDVDLQKFWNRHALSGSVGTLFLHPNDHPQDSDIVDIDILGTVRNIFPYPHPEGFEARNLVNAALYVLERDGLEDVTPKDGKADIAKDMFPRMLASERSLHGYISSEYIKDMGTPERLDKVEGDIISGLPDKLSSRHLRSAVFLDRDGTLIREVNHLTSPGQLELLPGVATAIRQLNRNGILSIVITNQPVVARGDITFAELDLIHARLETHLGLNGAYIDGLYFCPHHPQSGFKNEVPELKIRCRCRKPEPRMRRQRQQRRKRGGSSAAARTAHAHHRAALVAAVRVQVQAVGLVRLRRNCAAATVAMREAFRGSALSKLPLPRVVRQDALASPPCLALRRTARSRAPRARTCRCLPACAAARSGLACAPRRACAGTGTCQAAPHGRLAAGLRNATRAPPAAPRHGCTARRTGAPWAASAGRRVSIRRW
jgi:histidinol-phosphate phosphatase family protein